MPPKRWPPLQQQHPSHLQQQMHRVRSIVEAWGMHPIEASGFEADDVIATLVRAARETGKRVVIVSADKDLLQLVGDDVVMYDTMRDKVMLERLWESGEAPWKVWD